MSGRRRTRWPMVRTRHGAHGGRRRLPRLVCIEPDSRRRAASRLTILAMPCVLDAHTEQAPRAPLTSTPTAAQVIRQLFGRQAFELVAVATEVLTIIGANTACRSSTFKLHWLHRRSRLADDDSPCDLRERCSRERVGLSRHKIDKCTPHNAVRALIYSPTRQCGRRERSSFPRFATWTGLATDPVCHGNSSTCQRPRQLMNTRRERG